MNDYVEQENNLLHLDIEMKRNHSDFQNLQQNLTLLIVDELVEYSHQPVVDPSSTVQ